MSLVHICVLLCVLGANSGGMMGYLTVVSVSWTSKITVTSQAVQHPTIPFHCKRECISGCISFVSKFREANSTNEMTETLAVILVMLSVT